MYGFTIFETMIPKFFFFLAMARHIHKNELNWRSFTVDIKLGLSTDNYIYGLRTSKYS